MPSLRTKATAIKPAVKEKVYERDQHCCVYCGRSVELFFANAHIIPRSAGGLGIEQNIVTLCAYCHLLFDQTPHRGSMGAILRAYLWQYYHLDETKLVYTKGDK
jgi:5-methylcytosine-specific restriction endonuclease McrA